MYIIDLLISNVRLFEKLELSFGADGERRNWTVLIGENGLGKTTILQCIALAASGAARTNQLADVPSLRRRDQGAASSFISGLFDFGLHDHERRVYPRARYKPSRPPLLTSHIFFPTDAAVATGRSYYQASDGSPDLDARPAIPVGHTDMSELQAWLDADPVAQVRAKNLSNWFVVGYGVDRRLPAAGFTPKLDDPAVQRLAPLFDKGPIIATDFAGMFRPKERVAAYNQALRQALLTNAAILPKITDMVPRGQGYSRTARHMVEGDQFEFALGKSVTQIPATWLSQGYQATIAWIADLIGQMFWDMDEPVDIAEMEGLVLIDEIDIHLHPAWQVNLIEALKKTFPRLQFVVTTHSPMVLPGLRKEEILRVKQAEDGSVVVEPVNESPAVMTGSELYDAFFGVQGLFAKEVGDQLRRYGYLSSDPYRSDEEDREMARIQQVLRQADVLPEWQPVARELLE